MSGVCPYQSQGYSGRNLDNYCYENRDGEVEEFGTNRYNASWNLSTLEQRNTAQGINSAMRECLDPHNNQALSLHTGGMDGVENPILTGEYDVSCNDTDGLFGSNQVVEETYTVEYETSVDCEDSSPIAIIKSLIKFKQEPGSEPKCLEAEVTRTVAMDTSTTGTSGIIRGAAEKCIGLKTELTDQLDALPPQETTYSQEDHCRFPVNQTFTPAPSPFPFPSSTPAPTPSPFPFPSSTPSSTPSPFPFPSSTPSSTPSPFPFPSSTPNSTPSPFPFPSSTPSSTPSPFPFPSSTPAPTPGDFFEEHQRMIIVICAIALVLIIIIGIYILVKLYNPSQKFEGTGPAVARDNPPAPEPTQNSRNDGNGSSAPTPTTPLLPNDRNSYNSTTPPLLPINDGEGWGDLDGYEIIDLQQE